MSTRQSVCLTMIVKDEASVIERCLASVLPLIDCWSIVDTGSSDATIELIERTLAGLPGKLHRRPWRDFASNRNEALERARATLSGLPGRIPIAPVRDDYLLLIDADETLVLPPDFVLPALSADAYEFEHRYADMSYARVSLLAARMPWRYRGVLHEYLECAQASTAGLAGPWVHIRAEGARSRNPRKYHDDAALLERALAVEPENARNWFYLGQSWRDAGEPMQAVRAYRRRAAMPGWEEENWFALFQVARMLELCADTDPVAVRDAYLAAYQRRPSRAEPLVELARWQRGRGEFAQALLHARAAAQIPMPADRLFVDRAAHGWRALDEWSLAAWYCECFAEGAAAMRRLMHADPPADQWPRLQENLGFYRARGFVFD